MYVCMYIIFTYFRSHHCEHKLMSFCCFYCSRWHYFVSLLSGIQRSWWRTLMSWTAPANQTRCGCWIYWCSWGNAVIIRTCLMVPSQVWLQRFNISKCDWTFGLVVTMWGTSTKLLYIEPGWYWDGWPFTGIPFLYLTKPQPGHPSVGRQNEY